MRSHWCWSATDSNLHRRRRCQTAQNIRGNRQTLRKDQAERIQSEGHKHIAAHPPPTTVSACRVIWIPLKLSSNTRRRVHESEHRLRNHKHRALCSSPRPNSVFRQISLVWPDKTALAQARHHLRKLLARGERPSSEPLNHSTKMGRSTTPRCDPCLNGVKTSGNSADSRHDGRCECLNGSVRQFTM